VVLLGGMFLLSGTAHSAETRLYLLPAEGSTHAKQDHLAMLQAVPGVVTATSALTVLPQREGSRLERWIRVDAASRGHADNLLNLFGQDEAFEVVERAPVRTISAVQEADGLTNDPLSVFQWHLNQVNAQAAWDLVGDASDVVIAIIDNGVDLDHPDLYPILWTNTAERNGQAGLDDDQNGYVDDVYGWNAYDGNGNPNAPVNVTSRDHGTHCAGIAAAAHNNRIGVSGVAPGARIMAIRAGRGNQISNAVEGLIYAADNGANVISMSFSGGSESVFEYDAIRYAIASGAVLVAASGNEGSVQASYPAAYPGVIAVAATDIDNRVAGFSNTGSWVDIAAPGVDILSTVIDGYGYNTGTSMATPLVAGIVALILAMEPDASPEQVKSRLLQCSPRLPFAPLAGYPLMMADAWRTALANRPIVLVHGHEVNDDNGNGILEPGESGAIRLNLELLGASAELVTLQLSDVDGQFVLQGVQSWQSPVSGPFDTDWMPLIVDPSAARGFAPYLLHLSADGYSESRVEQLPIDPAWRTHKAGGMVASVTDFGAIGYHDYVSNRDHTDGVRLLNRATGFLFHGSVFVSDGVSVSDCAYGNSGHNRYDFFTLNGGEIRPVPGNPSAEIYGARYTDGAAPGMAGVIVDQTTTSYPNGAEILYLDLRVTPLSHLSSTSYVGIYCDWDIGTANNNTVRYNSSRRLSYVMGPSGAAGIVALGNTPISGVAAIDNATVIYNGFTDSEKLQLMTDGVSGASLDVAADVSHLLAVRLDDISPETPRVAHFALLAAASEAQLLELVTTLKDEGGQADPVGLPRQFTLVQAWPNPFNSGTMVAVHLPERGDLHVRVYDLLGRRVTQLAAGVYGAGEHRLVWQGRDDSGRPVASGVYFIQGEFGGLQEVRRIVLMR